MRKPRVALCGVIFAVMSTWCRPRQSAPLPAEPLPADPNARITALVAENLDAELRASPTLATWLGAHAYDDRLDDVRSEAILREAAREKQLIDQLRAIDESSLDAARALDRALLISHLELDFKERTETRAYERSAMFYASIAMAGLDDLLGNEAIALADRLRFAAARLRKVRALFDEARRNLRAPSEPLVRRAVEQLGGMKSFLTDTLPKLALSVGDSKLQDDLRVATGDAVRAIDDFVAWLQKDLLPRARPEPILGRERFIDWLKRSESIDTPPERIVEVAEADLVDARRRYEDAARALLTKPGDITKLIEDDHAKPDELLAQAQLLSDAIVAFARAQRLVSVAEAPRVVAMPPARWGYLQLDPSGPLEPKPRQAQLWIDPIDETWPAARRAEHARVLNRPQIVSTILHEGVPGRALLRDATRRAPTTMQKIFGSRVFQEGWIQYAAGLIVEQGYAADDVRTRVVLEREALLRDVRLIATVRLHALGGKPDDVFKLFTDEALLDEYAARREAERVLVDPSSLAPALGRLALRKLRDDAQRERGASFELRAFHDQVLGHGTVPIPVLRKLLIKSDGALL